MLNKLTKRNLLTAASKIGGALYVSVIVALAPLLLPLCHLIDFFKFKWDQSRRPSTRKERLTTNEVAFVKSIFGNKVRTKRVRKYLSPQERPSTLAQTINKKIIFYGTRFYSPDYSQTKDARNYNAFIHEMTHVWQFQRPLRMLFNQFVRGHQTVYNLSPTSRFKDFGVEQQAYIIGDYASQFLYPDSKSTSTKDKYIPTHQEDTQSRVLLAKVVEDKFPEARKTRLALEAQRKPSQKQVVPNPA